MLIHNVKTILNVESPEKRENVFLTVPTTTQGH